MQKLIKKISKFFKQEVQIKENIQRFVLAEWVQEVSNEITLLREFVKTGNQNILNYLKAIGAVLDFSESHNIIVMSGRSVLAARLAGDTTYTGAINYGLLGTGTPNVVNGATQLVGEVYRKTFSSHTFSANIAYVDFFFAATDCNGTYNEFGNVIDGTGSANTGQLFSYVATGSWVKSAIQSLFISCQYTLN